MAPRAPEIVSIQDTPRAQAVCDPSLRPTCHCRTEPVFLRAQTSPPPHDALLHANPQHLCPIVLGEWVGAARGDSYTNHRRHRAVLSTPSDLPEDLPSEVAEEWLMLGLLGAARQPPHSLPALSSSQSADLPIPLAAASSWLSQARQINSRQTR